MPLFDTGILRQAALLLAAGSAAAVLFSIAVSHILLGAALLTLILGRIRPAAPPVVWPLLVFFGWTMLALAFSPDPRAGLPQIRKFYVWFILILVYTTFRGARDARALSLVWAALATASGAWGIAQFWSKRQEALSQGIDFYLHYVADRATGFMSHWMTFSAEQMMAGLLLASLLLFGVAPRAWWAALAIIAASIAISWTRGVWLASAIAAAYLVAVWRPRLLLAAPVLLVAGFFVAPRSVQQRVTSIWQPRGSADSNTHRQITMRTGIAMMRAHPLVGVGPEIVGRDFMRYVPEDVELPLPDGFYGHLHNFYLQYAAERGIPAILALLAFIGKALIDFAGALRRLAPDEHLHRAVLHGAIACIIGIMVEGVFELNLGDTEVLTMFLAIVAFGYVAAGQEGTPAHA